MRQEIMLRVGGLRAGFFTEESRTRGCSKAHMSDHASQLPASGAWLGIGTCLIWASCFCHLTVRNFVYLRPASLVLACFCVHLQRSLVDTFLLYQQDGLSAANAASLHFLCRVVI